MLIKAYIFYRFKYLPIYLAENHNYLTFSNVGKQMLQ